MTSRKYVKKGQRYGLIPDLGNPGVVSSQHAGTPPVAYNTEWLYHILPSDSQGDLGACVGYAWATWFEAMLRKHVGRGVFSPGEQIDGEAIWRKGRRMFWANEPEEDGGLLLEHGFEAALALGILPPGSKLARCRRIDVAALSQNLMECPLVIAAALHDGWNFPQPESGFIRRMKGDPWQGHAIVLGGLTHQRGEPFYMIPNSWGTGWGWNGIAMLSEPHFRLNNLAMPAYAVLPTGWTGHEGWRRWIKQRPETAR